jgi:mannose-1-phosphate guanylyltransferase / phosphomannomutase
MVSVSRFLEMLAITGKSISTLALEVPPAHVMEAQVPCPFELKGTIMRKLVESSTGEEQELIDGVRIKRNGEWILLIPDPDRSYFLIFAEGPDKKRSKELLEHYKKQITDWTKKK